MLMKPEAKDKQISLIKAKTSYSYDACSTSVENQSSFLIVILIINLFLVFSIIH